MVVFALLMLPDADGGISPGDVPHLSGYTRALFLSLHTLSTVGYGTLAPSSVFIDAIVALESFVGLVVITLFMGVFFVRVYRPSVRVAFSQRCCVKLHNGVPSIVFRVANERSDVVYCGASMAMYCVIADETRKSYSQRRLNLVRDYGVRPPSNRLHRQHTSNTPAMHIAILHHSQTA